LDAVLLFNGVRIISHCCIIYALQCLLFDPQLLNCSSSKILRKVKRGFVSQSVDFYICAKLTGAD